MMPKGMLLASRARRFRALLGAGIALVIALLSLVTPEKLNPSTCLFREITGISCLTCGLTRSLHASVHGDILAAIHFHLLGPLCIAAMVIVTTVCLSEALSGTRLIRDCEYRLGGHAISGLLATGVFYGVLRALSELAG